MNIIPFSFENVIGTVPDFNEIRDYLVARRIH